MRSVVACAVLVACSGPPAAPRTAVEPQRVVTQPDAQQPQPQPQPAQPPAVPAGPPRLVVLFVIDQWPQWSFVQKRPYLTAGFDRLLREGEWHTGQYPYAATLTAPGHALLGSGQPTSGT